MHVAQVTNSRSLCVDVDLRLAGRGAWLGKRHYRSSRCGETKEREHKGQGSPPSQCEKHKGKKEAIASGDLRFEAMACGGEETYGIRGKRRTRL